MHKYSKLNWNAFYGYSNKHINDIAVVCGTGQTLLDYEPITNAIHIGCNSGVFLEKFIFDYYFFNDCKWASQELKDRIISYNPKIQKFLGTFVGDHSFGCSQEMAIKANALWYDCEGPFSILHNRGYFTKNIQNFWVGDGGGSTIFICMQFALFCGFKEINLVGCDITGSKHFTPNNRKSNLSYLFKSWLKFKQFLYEELPEVKINVINPVGLAGFFNDVYQTK